MIQAVDASHVDAYFDHMKRVVAENGTGSTPLFTALQPATYQPKPEQILKAWSTPVGEVGWIRTWAVWEGEKIVANVQLHGATSLSRLHRVTLSMAIEEKARGQGLGTQFMQLVLSWCAAEGLEWMDLCVFSGNEPARALYKKFEFEQVSYLKDAFRIFGRSVDEIQMTKAL